MRLSHLALVSLLAVPAAAQAGWSRVYPSLPPDLLGLHAASALDLWAVGAEGVVLHTSDGGIHWTETVVNTTELRAVDVRQGLAWVAGDGIHLSSDGGQSWGQVHDATDVRDIAFLDQLKGRAVTGDGRFLFTNDGGFSWGESSVPSGLAALTFVDADVGYVAGAAGALARTADGGASWTLLPSGTPDDLSDVQFVDANTGWLAARDRVLATADGGASWTDQPVPSGVEAARLSMLTATRGWTMGPAGSVARTTDGGATWVAAGAAGNSLTAFEMADVFSGYAAGADGAVWRTTDGAQTWTQISGGTGTGLGVRDVVTVDGVRLWAATEDSVILRSVDVGTTWEEVPAGAANTLWRAVDFWDASNGFAVGERQAFYPTTGWSDDGGQTWNVTHWTGMYDIADVDALGPDVALLCAETHMQRTTDHGVSWTSVSTTPQSSYWSADFVDPLHGWVVGSRIFETLDGGLTWSEQYASAQTLYSVSFADAQSGWAAGANGRIVHTSDGGATWTIQDAGAGNVVLQSVHAVSANVAWVVGGLGFVARTTDGGATWTQDAPLSATGQSMTSAWFFGADEGWVSANWQTGIWRRSGTGAACETASYCTAKANSLGQDALLAPLGTPSASGGGFSVGVTGAIPGQPGVMIFSEVGAGSAPLLGGTLCVDLPFTRLGIQVLDSFGATAYPVTIGAQLPGTTRWYQFWYRDPQHTDGTGAALSDGLRVTFCD